MDNKGKNNIKRIKVVHILQSAGGVAEYLKCFLKYIDTKKFENVIIASNDYINQKEVEDKCDKIFYVNMIRDISVCKDIHAIIKIRRIIKQEKPDIVYLHSSKAGALGRLATYFNKKVKIIYNAHGWYFNAEIGKFKKKVFELIERILAYRTDRIIAISKSEYESAIEKRICNKEKIVLIENGIDIAKYANYDKYREITRKKYSIKENDIIIGIVGRLSEQKDPISSIKAAVELIKENSSIYFMFIGSGELEDKVLQIAKENGIDSNIIITGWVNNVSEYIAAFDIALLPSKWEGFGLAILEYMICKKPIITTNVGGISNILVKENAFWIEKEKPDDIVNQVKKIINEKQNISNMLNDNYNECRNKYSIKRVVLQTENVFTELVENKRRK